ncbi:MAG TPA: polymer-forming cytoskeletal protein [Acidiferrobacterales bacterium]|nr:polymer-forming cytoskeletal protein [Acidiferrobacterales bacterium]
MSRRRSLDHLQKVPTILGREVVHVGVIEGRDNYVVHGRVEGNCDLDGVLLIGPDCLWIGNITADTVIVKGRVEGGIRAHFKIEVRPSARIKGDLSSPLIAVAEGAVLQGRVSPDSIITRFTERRSH